MAHVIGLTHLLLFAAAVVGRVPEKRGVLILFGLLVVQGMLVHVGQWFGFWIVAALHPVNAILLTGAAYNLAKRSSAYWSAEPDRAPAVPAGAVPTAA